MLQNAHFQSYKSQLHVPTSWLFIWGWWERFLYLRFGLKRTYSKAWVELLAVEMKLKRRNTRSGTPRMRVSCLWITCSRYDICCCVFRRNLYHPITFCSKNRRKKGWKVAWNLNEFNSECIHTNTCTHVHSSLTYNSSKLKSSPVVHQQVNE